MSETRAEQVPCSVKVRYSTSTADNPPVYAYSLTAEAVSSVGMPDHVFVFQRSTTSHSGNAVDTFIQIASPLECEEVPEDAPDLSDGMPYYRAKKVVLWFRCLEDLELAKAKIDSDLSVLVKTYRLLNGQQNVQEEKTYE